MTEEVKEDPMEEEHVPQINIARAKTVVSKLERLEEVIP